MHSKKIGIKQLKEYPYMQMSSGKLNLLPPKNLIIKWSNTGNPNPKEYIIRTPYLTS
jgi:hypothetical protein